MVAIITQVWHSTSMKTVAENRRARYDYEILETYEAGLQLTGTEVKACRDGHIHLSGSYISFVGLIPVLKQATISLYKHTTDPTYVPTRDRTILLRKHQLLALKKAVQERGVSIVPLAVKAGRFIKLEIALAKGKKRHDKRHSIKERQLTRALRTQNTAAY
jgi:SsrA-binding protein